MDDIQQEVVYSFIFMVCTLCFICPPKEVVAAGLTVQNIFASYLGSEDVSFVQYHIKRTSATILTHSLIPLVYAIGYQFVSGFSHVNSNIWTVCLIMPMLGFILYLYWMVFGCKFHPLVKTMSAHGRPWQNVAAQINGEFRSIDKFSSIMGGTSLYVTESWILKCTAYTVHAVQQTDSHLSVLGSEDHVYAHESNQQGAQLLHIKVISINPHVKPFVINLNSMDFQEMKDRLRSPLLHARNIVIHQSLSDRFVEAFREEVGRNGVLQLTSSVRDSLEGCIGCMHKQANVKLRKNCALPEDGECKECYCRPMWCLDCMGKWFASRQDQHAPETWLSGIAPCPTCRSKFCILDVMICG